MKAQAEKVWHVSNIFEIPGQRALGEKLVAATFADRVFFGNSGAEAMECAIKTARRYHYVNGRPERFRIITFEGAFHGRTLATLAAGGQKKYLEGFGPKVEGFDQVPFGDMKAAEAAITPETAAIMIEPIQGEGGIRSVPHEQLRFLRAALRRARALADLRRDPVRHGPHRPLPRARMGRASRRTSRRSRRASARAFRSAPALRRAKRPPRMTAGTHGTTFGGNPLAMAVGAAVLDIILDEAFLEQRPPHRTDPQAEARGNRRHASGRHRGNPRRRA